MTRTQHCGFELFRRFRRLSWQDRLLVLEAFFRLAVAGLAVRLLPFRIVGLLAARPIQQEIPHKGRLNTTERIRWAITRTATRVPWRALCFQQGLAAQMMLRRRGIPSVLYYGAAQDDRSGLHAHIWVRADDVDVIGGEIAHRFAILAAFPPADHSMGS
jgi:hypothetical protein